MKRNYKKYVLLLGLAIASISSCKKFLDVQPEDQIIDKQLFSTPSGVKTVLNGLYIDLASNNLYGNRLTLSTLEILGQRYNVPSGHSYYNIGNYVYNDAPTESHLESIWTSAYSRILNINSFLTNIDRYNGVKDNKTKSIYKGEAYAMRAFIHFDLLRLFGPRYSTADSVAKSIPYYNSPKSEIAPLLPANEVMDKVIADLKTAEQFLAEDPIASTGVNSAGANDAVDFLKNNRNYRFNLYAVKGLLARAYLYRGDKVNALDYAKQVIAVANEFPWTSTSNALNEKQNPDRIFSTEMILGVMNTQLYSLYTSNFDPNVGDASILAPIATRLATTFESNENDYRYNLNWQVPSTGVKTYRTFYKYADIVDKTKTFRFTIPLLKISEMYYIAAECEPLAADGIAQLNVVRQHRGLTALAPTAALNTELQKEYQKEFYGEGQIFYFYKRRNITSVPKGSAASGNITINYNIPLPLSETQYR